MGGAVRSGAPGVATFFESFGFRGEVVIDEMCLAL